MQYKRLVCQQVVPEKNPVAVNRSHSLESYEFSGGSSKHHVQPILSALPIYLID